MKLPGRHKLRITRAKMANYLLSPTHPSGRYKAVFFQRFGFSLARTDMLKHCARMVRFAKLRRSRILHSGCATFWRVNSQLLTAATRWSDPFGS